MAQENAAFVGSVPENYDRYLGPAFFAPYAEDIVARVPMRDGISVLETACGSGIVTKHLRKALPGSARLVATDLNEGMVALARQKLGAEAVEWEVADAMSLPFADGSFDAVVFQFGLMFMPDKAVAVREAHRVLKPGGKFLFNVWDSMKENDFSRLAHHTILSFFTDDPPRFFEIPYGFYDQALTRDLLGDVGFQDINTTAVDLTSVSPSATAAARGLIQGTPVFVAVKERDASRIPALTEAVAAALERECGSAPCRGRMRAFVWEATR